MALTEISHTVVVIADDVRPKKFTEGWFIKNGILQAGQLFDPSFTTDKVTALNTSRFDLIVNPGRLQFTPRPSQPNAEFVAAVEEVLAALTEPGIKGVGLNHGFGGPPRGRADGVPLSEFSMSIFGKEGKFADALQGKDLIFGANAFVKWKPDCSLRVQVTPMFPDEDRLGEAVGFAADFNFHFRVRAENDIELAVQCVRNFDDSLTFAWKTVASLESTT